MAAGGGQGIIKHIIGVIHPVHPENGLETTLVEAGVVRHQRESLNERINLLPDVREHRRILGVLRPQPVHPPAEPLIILRLRMDQAVEPVYNLPSADNHHPHAAHAGQLLVRRLKVLCWGDSYVGLIWK